MGNDHLLGKFQSYWESELNEVKQEEALKNAPVLCKVNIRFLPTAKDRGELPCGKQVHFPGKYFSTPVGFIFTLRSHSDHKVERTIPLLQVRKQGSEKITYPRPQS